VVANRPKEYAVLDVNDSPTGNFLRAKAWSRGSERMLLADSKFWTAVSNRAPNLPSYPPAVVAQPRLTNDSAGIGNAFDAAGNQTIVDIYRHGKYPKLIGTNFDPRGGKIAYNILYADGHVGSPTDAREAYRSFRMKFPG
jgi:prepilin-type processing-associated H-X9-DG protein